MGQKSPFVVCLGTFAGLPQPSRSVALYESGVPWVSAIQGPPPGCSLLLTPFFLHSIPSTVPCFLHSPVSSALVSSDCVCIFLLWHSTFSENHASGEALDLAQKPLHFLQVGPAQYVLETELDSLVFVHTLGSGLWTNQFHISNRPATTSSIMEMNETLTVRTGISLILSKKYNKL